MNSMKIFVINPGSTSTKLALYDGMNPVWAESVFHPVAELAQFSRVYEQLEYLKQHVYCTLQ